MLSGHTKIECSAILERIFYEMACYYDNHISERLDNEDRPYERFA
jgi:hypothetical protein